MSKSLEKTINQFQTELIDLGFQKWDVDKDYNHLHIFQYKAPNERGLFVEIFDAKAYEHRKGDVNIYLNPVSNFKKYRPTDHIFHTLAWHVLEKADITAVIGNIEGKEKGELTLPFQNDGTSEPYRIMMIDCDIRSLNPKSREYTPSIIQEIVYLKNLVNTTNALVLDIGNKLFDQAKNYPHQIKKK